MARIAFLVDEMFEDSEFLQPLRRMHDEGHDPVIVGTEAGRQVTGKHGAVVTIGRSSADVTEAEFDALIIPGGYSPDKVRTDEAMVTLTRQMDAAGKPVAAICHAPWVLAEADLLRGRTVTSYPSIRTDLKNAGAQWEDKEVVEDDNLITSRNPGDIPAFCDAVLRHVG